MKRKKVYFIVNVGDCGIPKVYNSTNNTWHTFNNAENATMFTDHDEAEKTLKTAQFLHDYKLLFIVTGEIVE